MSHDQVVRVDDEDAGRARGVDRPAIGCDDDATTDRTAPAAKVLGKDDRRAGERLNGDRASDEEVTRADILDQAERRIDGEDGSAIRCGGEAPVERGRGVVGMGWQVMQTARPPPCSAQMKGCSARDRGS
jgi:hypothetical protein